MAPKKTTTAAAATPAPEPVVTKVETTDATTTDATTTETTTTVDQYASLITRLQGYINDFKDMIVIVKALQKENTKLQKATAKKTKKTAGADGGAKRSPSGFAKPTKLSDQMCNFLGVANGTSMARTEVTRIINEYIKKNNLQNPKDKRQIIPDAKLKGILNYKDGEKLSYFNIQSCMKHQFIKADA